MTGGNGNDPEAPTPEDFDAIRAGLDYASARFEACSTSPDVEWRREDNAKLTAAREALDKLERASRANDPGDDESAWTCQRCVKVKRESGE